MFRESGRLKPASGEQIGRESNIFPVTLSCDARLPPLSGLQHSIGVLNDATDSPESFMTATDSTESLMMRQTAQSLITATDGKEFLMRATDGPKSLMTVTDSPESLMRATDGPESLMMRQTAKSP